MGGTHSFIFLFYWWPPLCRKKWRRHSQIRKRKEDGLKISSWSKKDQGTNIMPKLRQAWVIYLHIIRCGIAISFFFFNFWVHLYLSSTSCKLNGGLNPPIFDSSDFFKYFYQRKDTNGLYLNLAASLLHLHSTSTLT